MSDLDRLIDDLSEDAGPVRVLRSSRGRMILAAIAAATVAAIGLTLGLRPDVLGLSPSPILVMTSGLLAIVALSAGAAAIRMSRPQVGAPASGAPWALASLALLPLAALASMAASPDAIAGFTAQSGPRCLAVGFIAGLGSLVFLAAWLRKGAPVSPERASWLAGAAAGAIGALAVSLECAFDALAHMGIWHVAVVGVMAALGRLILPPIIRW